MKDLFSKEVLGSRLVLGALGAAVIIALGAGIYYWEGSRTPTASVSLGATATSTAQGTGTVEASQDGALAFQTGGRVVEVPQIGATVAAGQQIASLDTASLSAQLEQAQAGLASAQANLDQLNAGPRAVDLAPKQTAVASAQQTLTNDYASASQALASAYSSVYQAVHADTDSLIQNPDSATPTLVFQTNSSQTTSNVLSSRTQTDSELTAWSNELASLSNSSSPEAIEAAGGEALDHLDVALSFGNALTAALAAAIPTSTFPASSVTAANASVGAMTAAVEAQISILEADQQKLSSDQLALQSAQDALAQAQTPSTPQDIEAAQAAVQGAQASVDSDDAQLQNAIIVAPFSGSISGVAVKAGDIVTAGTTAVTVTPQSGLEVVANFSEIDAASLKAGMPADVTLDAYGENRHFPATIVSVDRSPVMQGGSNGQPSVPAYQVTVQFNQNDPAIAVGMSANVVVNTQ